VIGMPLTEICNAPTLTRGNGSSSEPHLTRATVCAARPWMPARIAERIASIQWQGESCYSPTSTPCLSAAYVQAELKHPIGLRLKKADNVGNKASSTAQRLRRWLRIWRPHGLRVVPVSRRRLRCEAFEKVLLERRVEKETGKHLYAIVSGRMTSLPPWHRCRRGLERRARLHPTSGPWVSS